MTNADQVVRSLVFVSFFISFLPTVFYWIKHDPFRVNFGFFLRSSGVILFFLSTMWCAGAVGDYSAAVRSDVLSHGVGFSVAFFVVGFLLRKSKRPAEEYDQIWLTDKPKKTIPKAAATKEVKKVPITELTIIPEFPSSKQDMPLCYRYDDVYLTVPASFFTTATAIPSYHTPQILMYDPATEHGTGPNPDFFFADCKTRLCSIPDNKLGKMAMDWNRRHDPYYFPITSIDPEHNKVTISMLFYREDRHRIPMDEPGEESYRLIGNSRNAEMQEQIDLCEVGDECTLEFDADKDKYLVSCGAPIGYLPKSARRLVDEYGAEDVTVTIDDTSIDSDGRASVYVTVDV